MVKTKRSCCKCKTRGNDVEIRQSDDYLCNKCESKRLEQMKEIEKSRKSNDKSSPTGLEKYVSSLKAKEKPTGVMEKLFSTPTKLLNRSFAAAASSLLLDQQNPSENVETVGHDRTLKSSKCVHSSCNISSPDEPVYSCSVCSRSWHITCAGLSKVPVRKWTCADCKDLHSLTKSLQKIVTSLQHEVASLKSSQSELVKSQKVLQTENVELRSRQVELKSLQESLQTENQTLRQEVVNLKEALTRESPCPSRDNPATDPDDSTSNDHPTASFIIGDSMLRDIKSSMFANTQVKSISGATASNVFDELNGRKDLHSYKDIVIHVGTNDVAKNIPLDETISSMEASITLIMVKAPTAQVHVSAVCPRTKDQLQHKIDTLNTAFKDLANRLDCNFIDSATQMVYRNGRVDETQLSDGLHLSNRGTETLTSVLVDRVPGIQRSLDNWNWSKVTYRKNSKRKHESNRKTQHEHSSRQSPHKSEADQRPRKNISRESFQKRWSANQNTHGNHRRDNPRPSYSGCYNCGLKNHNQDTCYYKYRIQCNTCNRFGHKAKYCNSKRENPRY